MCVLGRCSGDWEGTQEGVMALPCFLLTSGQICTQVYQELNCKTAPAVSDTDGGSGGRRWGLILVSLRGEMITGTLSNWFASLMPGSRCPPIPLVLLASNAPSGLRLTSSANTVLSDLMIPLFLPGCCIDFAKCTIFHPRLILERNHHPIEPKPITPTGRCAWLEEVRESL